MKELIGQPRKKEEASPHKGKRRAWTSIEKHFGSERERRRGGGCMEEPGNEK